MRHSHCVCAANGNATDRDARAQSCTVARSCHPPCVLLAASCSLLPLQLSSSCVLARVAYNTTLTGVSTWLLGIPALS